MSTHTQRFLYLEAEQFVVFIRCGGFIKEFPNGFGTPIWYLTVCPHSILSYLEAWPSRLYMCTSVSAPVSCDLQRLMNRTSCLSRTRVRITHMYQLSKLHGNTLATSVKEPCWVNSSWISVFGPGNRSSYQWILLKKFHEPHSKWRGSRENRLSPGLEVRRSVSVH